ncbi:MAG: metal-dependent hydrolase [Planctomycetes bacterium]|nr:metal-dependent hydrolase [Planctomycetota bacterium]
MSSPVGHGLVALAGYEAVRCAFVPRGGAGTHAPAPRRDDATGPEAALARRWPWLFVLGAVLPDIDSILMPLAGERRVAFLNVAGGVDAHRGLTHTLVFALAAGLFLFACGSSGLPRAPLAFAPALVLAVALHPARDWAMAHGAGLPFLWPFSDRRFRSPWPLVPSAYYAVSLAGSLRAQLVRSPAFRGCRRRVATEKPPLHPRVFAGDELGFSRVFAAFATASLGGGCQPSVAVLAARAAEGGTTNRGGAWQHPSQVPKFSI